MSKHTPGPWGLTTEFGMSGMVAPEPANETHPICSMTGYYHRAGQTEANARLIAAAPELLGALKEMLFYAGSLELAYTERDGECRPMQAARAAIAKAEGGNAMTRAERIEAAAKVLVSLASEHDKHAAKRRLQDALALPPDPAPRRLTGDDVLAMAEWLKSGDIVRTEDEMADFLNARIFGEQK